MTDSASLFGKGIAFPPRIDSQGRLAWSVGEDDIVQSLRILLSTGPGERVGRHGWGAGLGRFLFEPNTLDTHTLIARSVADAVARWEPRVRLESVDVDADPDDPCAARAVVTYRLSATRELRRLPVSIPVNSQNPS